MVHDVDMAKNKEEILQIEYRVRSTMLASYFATGHLSILS